MNSVPYSKLALIYDKVMDHVNYLEWSQYISMLLNEARIKKGNVIDISCGSGKHLLHLKPNMYAFFGSDISTEMLKRAKQNVVGKEVNFLTQDARELALKRKSVEAVLMLYDSINYILTKKGVIGLFNEVNRILKPGGLFIFDIVTQHGLKECFDDYYESNSWDGLAYERHSWYSLKNRVQQNEFIFLYNGKSYKEIHKQKIRTIKEWRELILKSNMKLSQEFSNFSKSTASETSERVHFVCHSLKD